MGPGFLAGMQHPGNFPVNCAEIIGCGQAGVGAMVIQLSPFPRLRVRGARGKWRFPGSIAGFHGSMIYIAGYLFFLRSLRAIGRMFPDRCVPGLVWPSE
jgi:hypothetical protein